MYIQIPLQAALEKAFAQHLPIVDSSRDGAAGFEWRVRFKFFPHPSLTSASVAGQIAPVFILASLMFNFVMALTSVVSCLDRAKGGTPCIPYSFVNNSDRIGRSLSIFFTPLSGV
jgi:hypothetical protein